MTFIAFFTLARKCRVLGLFPCASLFPPPTQSPLCPPPKPRKQSRHYTTMSSWTPPSPPTQAPLLLNNSLAHSPSPVDFHSLSPKKVSWYTCGPTVYDSAHLGHARLVVVVVVLVVGGEGGEGGRGLFGAGSFWEGSVSFVFCFV